MADKFSLIRSISHNFVGHGNRSKRMMTGRISNVDNFVNEAPAGAEIVAKMREHLRRGMPHNVMMVDSYRVNPVDGWYELGAAYLGQAYRPFEVSGNPSEAGFQVHNLSLSTDVAARLNDRQLLLKGMDQLRRDMALSGAMAAMDRYNLKAYELLTRSSARRIPGRDAERSPPDAGRLLGHDLSPFRNRHSSWIARLRRASEAYFGFRRDDSRTGVVGRHTLSPSLMNSHEHATTEAELADGRLVCTLADGCFQRRQFPQPPPPRTKFDLRHRPRNGTQRGRRDRRR